MRYVRLWVPAIAWMICIGIFSSQTRISVSEEKLVNFLVFKTLHLIEYAVLYVLVFRAVKYSHHSPAASAYLYAFILTFLYAITDELHQLYVPTREGKVRDVIIDAIGAGIAWISTYTLLRKAPVKLKNWLAKWQLI